jgi:hypothetical protein
VIAVLVLVAALSLHSCAPRCRPEIEDRGAVQSKPLAKHAHVSRHVGAAVKCPVD